ncbi:hypothetical protein K438DRAFT_1979856 [Mycena galopus ATCC 62051]|nr:hypothetical protein K438DRAFT_1979856 [Mycena galopus ATCC 62051]
MASNQGKSAVNVVPPPIREAQAQAAELGLGTRGDRQPQGLAQVRTAAGELLREISRKVAKIWDAGLSDYELRNLDNDINKQLHEKWHSPHQIAAGTSRFWMIEKGGAGDEGL